MFWFMAKSQRGRPSPWTMTEPAWGVLAAVERVSGVSSSRRMLLLCLRQPMNIVSQLQNLCRLRGECSCEMFRKSFIALLLLCKALCNALLVLVQVQDSVRLRRLAGRAGTE